MHDKPAKPARSDAVLVRMSDVKPEPVEWLWQDRFALGKTSMILGDPDLGKSFLTLDIAARVSTGTPFPDRPDVANPVGSVVLLSAEDDPADTIRPRLDAALADASKVILLKMIRTYHDETGDVVERSFSLERDLAALKAVLAELPDCRLIIIDPISAYLGSTDSHVNAKIRGLLSPLAQLAADHHVAIVMVTHLSKNAAGTAMYRSQASIAFVAAARSAWLVVQDKDNPARRFMLPVKNNLTAERSGVAFSLVRNRDGMGEVHWEAAPVTMRADDALGALSPSDTKSTALAEAAEWLRDQLRDGPQPAKAVKESAVTDGIKARTLDRAKCELGVIASREGFGGPWVWKLPDSQSAPSDSEERQPNSVAHYEDFGALPDSDAYADAMGDEADFCGLVPDGWAPMSWAAELERKAGCCESTNPALAAEYRQQAAAIRAASRTRTINSQNST